LNNDWQILRAMIWPSVVNREKLIVIVIPVGVKIEKGSDWKMING
jgi:hypothetical protein